MKWDKKIKEVKDIRNIFLCLQPSNWHKIDYSPIVNSFDIHIPGDKGALTITELTDNDALKTDDDARKLYPVILSLMEVK